MFAFKYLSVILMCVFRMVGGVVSSGLLTSGNVFVLNVIVVLVMERDPWWLALFTGNS